jgi:hypothetical protein
MAIDLAVKNAHRIAEVNKKIAELCSKRAKAVATTEYKGIVVDSADTEILKALLGIREALSRTVGDKEVYDFGDIAYVDEDDVKVVYLYNEGGTGLDVPKSISRRGFIPGIGIASPLPRRDGESIETYEKYLRDYYKGHGVEVFVDSKTGLRDPYPHEKYKWVNGRACVPKQGESYVDEYYDAYRTSVMKKVFFDPNRTYTQSFFDRAGANRFQQSQGATQTRQGQPQNGQPGQSAQNSQPNQTRTRRSQNGQPAPGAGQPNPNRVTAPRGRTGFRRRTLQRAPEDRHGFFDRIFGAVYDFDHALGSPGVTKNYKKILKVVGIVLGVAAVAGLTIYGVIPFLGMVVDSIAKSFAIASAPQIGAGIAKLLALGLGITVSLFFAKYVKKRKAISAKAGDPDSGSNGDGESNPPAGGPRDTEDEHIDPMSFTDPAQLVNYIRGRMAKFNAELAALDAEEMNLKNPGPISPEDQQRINKKRALIEEGRKQLMDILMSYRTSENIDAERVMGGR